jgi:two-component system nitrogen regulation response regulator GlnG
VLGKALAGQGLDVAQTDDGRRALDLLKTDRYEVAVVDIKMPSLSGLDVLREVRTLENPPHVIVITAQNTMANAIDAMKSGAYEYLCKPFDIDLFEELVLRAVKDRAEVAKPPQGIVDGDESRPDTKTLYGRSPAMQRVFKAIGRAAASDYPVLVTGESGTGKELVARILHRESDRASDPFIAVNVAAIPGDLLEADLFGHTRGAFTGAHRAKPGKFAAAQGGTLFLDEIGEMPAALQAKLLRVLQEREYYPLGAERPVRVDVRIVAATNRNLAEQVRAGQFRGDLFYRLNVLTLELPPLRDRTEDIPMLAESLLERHAASRSIPERSLSEEAVDWLSQYTWPGNVRELENTLVRAATFAQGPIIRVPDLVGPTGKLNLRRTGAQEESFEDMLLNRLRPVVRNFPEPQKKERFDLHNLVVGTAERVVLELVVQRTGGNQVRAAALLGLNRNTLRRKLDEHEIDVNEVRRRTRRRR